MQIINAQSNHTITNDHQEIYTEKRTVMRQENCTLGRCKSLETVTGERL